MPAIVPSSAISTRARERVTLRPERRASTRIEHDAVRRDRHGEHVSIDSRFGERALDEHGVLREPDRAQIRRRRRAGHASARPLPHFVDAIRPLDRRDERIDRAGDDARGRDGAVAVHRAVGDGRPLRAEANDVLARAARRAPCARTGRPVRGPLSATGASTLPPNAPPFASGDAGAPPGALQDASSSRYAGSTQPVTRRTPPAGSASGSSGDRCLGGRAPALHLSRTRSRVEQRLGHDPRDARGLDRLGGVRVRADRRSRRNGTATSASRGARSSANLPVTEWYPGADGLDRAALERGPLSLRRRGRRGGESEAAGAHVRCRSRRTPSAIRCSDTSGRRGPDRDRPSGSCPLRAAPPPARRSPACRIRTAIPRLPRTRPANARLTVASRPSTVVTARPATRVTGVTQATRGSPSTSTVQQPHCPCGAHPSLTDTTPSRSRSTESSDSPGAELTSTCSPLHVNWTRSDTTTSGGQDRGDDLPSPSSTVACRAVRSSVADSRRQAGSSSRRRSAAPRSAASTDKLAPLVLSCDLYASDQPQRLVVALARREEWHHVRERPRSPVPVPRPRRVDGHRVGEGTARSGGPAQGTRRLRDRARARDRPACGRSR